MRALCVTEENHKEIFSDFQAHGRTYLYGAGYNGKKFLAFLRQFSFPIAGFIDDNPALWNTTVEDLPVYSLKDIRENINIIITPECGADIDCKISDSSCTLFNIFPLIASIDRNYLDFPEFPMPKDKITWFSKRDYVLSKICKDKLSEQIYGCFTDAIKANTFFNYDKISIHSSPDHYLINEVIDNLCKNPVIVDCGAYLGELPRDMLRKGIQYKTIYAFEATHDTFLQLKERISAQNMPNIIPYNYAVWDTDTELKISVSQELSSRNKVSENGELTVKAKALDTIIPTTIDFLKMDIEGAELPALRGAQRLLIASRPILAISIYHSMDELVDIPLYLYELLEDYRFFVRHHSWRFSETVLYGIPNERCASTACRAPGGR